MLTGLRASDATTIQAYCGSNQRLLLRIGALLQQQLACTEAVLAELAADPKLQQLLLAPALKTCTIEDFPALCTEHQCQALDLTMSAGDIENDNPWRIVSLADELNNPLFAASPEPEVLSDGPGQQLSLAGVNELLPSLSAPVRDGIEGLMSAHADEQRAAALEQLRYAAPSLRVVSELMPLVLADTADLVRERAISLLTACGAKVVVVDLIRALQRQDGPTIRRLADSLHLLDGEQSEVLIAALIATCSRGDINQEQVYLCQQLAPHLAHHQGLQRLLELFIPHGGQISLLRMVRQLQHHNQAACNQALTQLLGQHSHSDAHIIVLLAQEQHELPMALVDQALGMLCHASESPKDGMALATALLRSGGPKLSSALARTAPQLANSQDSSVFWLIGECCRRGSIAAEQGSSILQAITAMMRNRQSPHLMAILEQQLPRLLPAHSPDHAACLDALGELAVSFRDPRSRSLLHNIICGAQVSELPSLTRIIEEHPQESVRILFIECLASICQAADAPCLSQLLEQMLSHSGSLRSDRERAALLLALAQLVQLEQLPAAGDWNIRIDQACQTGRSQSVPAWGYLCAGPHLPLQRRIAIIEQIIQLISDEVPDKPQETKHDPLTDETTFVLDSALGSHTEVIPLAIQALVRIGTSTDLPAAPQRRITQSLCKQWKRVSSWEVIWGPANVQELGRSLGTLASHGNFPDSLRMVVAEALLPSITHLPLAITLAGILRSCQGSGLADLASRAVGKIVQASSAKQFADDEQDELCQALAHFLFVPHYGEDSDKTRRQIASMLSTLRHHCNARCRQLLSEHLASMPEDIQQRLNWLNE